MISFIMFYHINKFKFMKQLMKFLLLPIILFALVKGSFLDLIQPKEPPPPPPKPVPKRPIPTSCSIHRFYALDSSSTMAGSSWEYANAYFTNETINFKDLVSSFQYRNQFSPPLNLQKFLNPPWIYRNIIPPSGEAKYSVAFYKLKSMISDDHPQVFPEKSYVINIISNGYTAFTTKEKDQLELLKEWLRSSCQRTINCVQTKRFSTPSNFQNLCTLLNLPINILQPETSTSIGPFVDITNPPK